MTYEKKYANLHFHTEHSDHMRSPFEVIRLGVEEGFQAFAVTDHDSVSGWKECREACEHFGVEFLPGCEFYGSEFDVTFHITAYDFDPSVPEMKDLLAYTRKRNLYILKTRFDLAVAKGKIRGITFEEVLERNQGIDYLFHDHAIRLMIEKGLLTREERPEFIRENFDSRFVPIPIPIERPRIRDILSAIKAAGGVSVMAHPGYEKRQAYMEPLIEMGIQGIELCHPANDKETREKVAELCQKHRLYIGGGTDHHGYMEGYPHFDPEKNDNHKDSLFPCECGVTKEEFEMLKNRIYG